ncbi:30S ribosomal protein S17 [Candidatus Pacearchaeota archaeon CG10_big_fil_rev_8_21_14_0_10_32_14]|nr:MAG: 30S ribosomal protein S17 [Candidatus Pacearchaeota archaeon CG10_big_fil_rev_8_21_14_0_10_32_14]
MKEKKQKKTEEKMSNGVNTRVAGAATRGRVFEGTVIKKFPTRVVIQFERTVYVSKYERYSKAKTKIHARLPSSIENQINVGDYIKVQECRPLSKLIHSVVIEKIRGKDEMMQKKTGENKK